MTLPLSAELAVLICNASKGDVMPKRLKPDTRLDWRDPNMPVLGKSGRPIPHEKMVLKAQLAMQITDEPKWRDDPTYNLRKDKRK